MTMKTIFELKRIKLKSPRYPSRKTDDWEIGFYTSLQQAEKNMQAVVAEEKKDREEAIKDGDYDFSYDDTLGFSIEEIRLNEPDWNLIVRRTYTKEGLLNDEWSDAAVEDEPGEAKPFYGRPEEKIRFKVGDIVEVWQFGRAELCIICYLPVSTKEYEERKQKRIEKLSQERRKELLENRLNVDRIIMGWDSSDDCYLVYSLGRDDTHSHPDPTSVFAPVKRVPASLKRKLRAKLMALGILYEIKLPDEFVQQCANDSKVIDEMLNDFERMSDRFLADCSSFIRRTNLLEVQALLNFSEKQAERFERFYTKCKWLAAKKEEKEREKEQSY